MWLVELLGIIVKRRRFIIVNTAIVTILAVIICFILPKTFRAEATILPPENSSPLSGLIGLSAGQIAQAVTNFSLPLMATPSDLYASMLESETILREVVDSLDLMKIYRSKTPWDAVATLKEKVNVRVEREGIIVIEADARQNKLSADIANRLVYALDHLNRHMQNQRGRDYSIFLEKRLKETEDTLAIAQKELKDFQEKNRAVSLELQSEALITNLAEQKAKLTAAEIEMEIMRRTLYPSHPELINKEISVAEMRRKLREIEEGASNEQDSILSALDIPLSRVPDLSLKFAVLKRNLRIQELTYELISQQLEMARMQEHRDTPTVMVLDTARPPDLPIKPRKTLIVATAFFLALILSGAIVVGSEGMQRKQSESPALFHRFGEVFNELRKRPFG